jgi:mono/diheme cytochrome c family protein
MRWTRWLSLSLSLAAVAAAATAVTPSLHAADKAGSKDDRLARGKYLLAAMPCVDCHTPGTLWGAPDQTRAYSGSEMAWVGPWGAVYASNLTPDPETGLGKWTVEQIATAIRTGNRPDGRQLSPAMPWMSLANLTEEDALALATALKALPPVVHMVPAPIPPGQPIAGPKLEMPPPSEWDARNLPKSPDAAQAGHEGHKH